MNYELAKQLRDNGFPQEQVEVKDGLPGYAQSIQNGNHHLDEGGKVYEPTLSELIEACGEDFKKLFRYTLENEIWFECNDITTICGSTPEEAVANLWLALNNK